MVANIEGRELRRQFLYSHNLPPDHPRACTTDDVEYFFTIMWDMLGSDFALKRVFYTWKRLCIEFSKTVDLELPFYYFIAAHGRFYEASRPSFINVPPRHQPKTQRLMQQEMIAGQPPGRTTLPTPGSRSVRLTYHNVPVNMPPAPHVQSHATDHPYS